MSFSNYDTTSAQFYYTQIKDIYNDLKSKGTDILSIMEIIDNNIPVSTMDVDNKVLISKCILNLLTYDDRKQLAIQLLQEQVIEQRNKLSLWSTITAQSSQIDTGYIAQHLVTLQSQICGQGMRGKGDDLFDGSEVKSANFLDSLDKKGATAPRWNFTAVTLDIMERFLEYPAIYLLSMDLNNKKLFRTRIWKVDISKHTILRDRYKLWMKEKGYPKFNDTSKKPSVNFQLFPPREFTNEDFARHGNGRKNGFPKLEIPLNNYPGSELVFHAEENPKGKIEIYKF